MRMAAVPKIRRPPAGEKFAFDQMVGQSRWLGWTGIAALAGLLADPRWIYQVWKGGMSFHGGFLGVLIAMVVVDEIVTGTVASVASASFVSSGTR